MRKINLVLAIPLVLALFAGLALNQVGAVSAQGDSPVGVVIAYVPGVSITIVDVNGTQIEYVLDASLKIEPADKADSLKVGSFVTIIAPANIDKTKKTAVGIVVHPDKPEGFKIPGWVATALIKDTPVPTNVPPTEETKVSDTPTAVETESMTATPVETLTATPTPETTTKDNGTNVKVNTNSFIEWLRSLFR